MIKSFASSASRCSLVVDLNFIYQSERRSETNNKSRQFGSDRPSAAINFRRSCLGADRRSDAITVLIIYILCKSVNKYGACW